MMGCLEELYIGSVFSSIFLDVAVVAPISVLGLQHQLHIFLLFLYQLYDSVSFYHYLLHSLAQTVVRYDHDLHL